MLAADRPAKNCRQLAIDRGQAGPGKQSIRNQLRALVSIDEGVGRIFKALEETKQLDNTLIVFTSDNGYFWGEHGLGDKRAAYEESIRVPLLMRYPKLIKAGSKIDADRAQHRHRPDGPRPGRRADPGGHARPIARPPARGRDRGLANRRSCSEYFVEKRVPAHPDLAGGPHRPLEVHPLHRAATGWTSCTTSRPTRTR